MSMYRIEDGITSLIQALTSKLTAESIKTEHAVTGIRKSQEQWQLDVTCQSQDLTFSCGKLILAIPPRMITQHLSPDRWASQTLQNALNAVPTWVAAQAKFVATYTAPFWREQGLSGQAFSQCGPMQEMHDACDNHGKSHALFGFIGIPVSQRQQYSAEQIKQACISQLVSLYGEQAANIEHCYLKDWAQDKWVTAPLDLSQPPVHPYVNLTQHQQELDDKNVYLVASEFARQEAGYLEGAIYAVNDMVQKTNLTS